MRHRLLLVLPLALGAVAVPSAHASYYGVGTTCGLASAPVDGKQVGIVAAGPLVMPAMYGGTTSVTVTCRVQVGDPSYDGTGPEVSTTFDGSVGGLAERTVTFDAASPRDVYLCTTVSWTGAEGPGSANVDFDTTPGEQCAQTFGWTDYSGGVVIPAQPMTVTT